MITGFNTDIEHDGVVYHVQTEDKGIETPLILSLVYSGGAILASKRSRYEDLIAAGYSDEALSERLTRQHKLICAAIHAGRIEDLKRMSASPVAVGKQQPKGRKKAPQVQPETQAQPKVEAQPEIQPNLEILRGDEEREALEADRVMFAEQERLAREAEKESEARETPEQVASVDLDDTLVPPPAEAQPEPPPPNVPPESVYTVHDPRRQTVMGEVAKADFGLRITILGRQEFRSGETPTIKVMVGFRSGSQEQPVPKAAVSVKVLGTTFRPQIYAAKTQNDGVAVVTAQIPKFTSGRAAILIKAVAADLQTELRRVILPG